jgi:hypothetical protein
LFLSNNLAATFEDHEACAVDVVSNIVHCSSRNAERMTGPVQEQSITARRSCEPTISTVTVPSHADDVRALQYIPLRVLWLGETCTSTFRIGNQPFELLRPVTLPMGLEALSTYRPWQSASLHLQLLGQLTCCRCTSVLSAR